jgi:hypothetical protein
MQVLPVTGLCTGTRVREGLELHPHRRGASCRRGRRIRKAGSRNPGPNACKLKWILSGWPTMLEVIPLSMGRGVSSGSRYQRIDPVTDCIVCSQNPLHAYTKST